MKYQDPVASYIWHEKRSALIQRYREHVKRRDEEIQQRLTIMRHAYQRHMAAQAKDASTEDETS